MWNRSGRGSERGGSRRRIRRFAVALVLLAAPALVAGAAAGAQVTLGQLAPTPATGFCGVNFDRMQPTVNSGASYVAPGAGTLTSWSTNAGANTGQMLTMKVFRKIADPATFEVIAHDTQPLDESALNTFPIDIPVQGGDVLGVNSTTSGAAATYCDFPASDSYPYFAGNLADGASADFTSIQSNDRVNVSAQFEFDNAFKFGATKRNSKTGTATLAVKVPNPGALVLAGHGLKHRSGTATQAGYAHLAVKATGSKRKTLRRRGKVYVTANVVYRPTGGDSESRLLKVRLTKHH